MLSGVEEVTRADVFFQCKEAGSPIGLLYFPRFQGVAFNYRYQPSSKACMIKQLAKRLLCSCHFFSLAEHTDLFLKSWEAYNIGKKIADSNPNVSIINARYVCSLSWHTIIATQGLSIERRENPT